MRFLGGHPEAPNGTGSGHPEVGRGLTKIRGIWQGKEAGRVLGVKHGGRREIRGNRSSVLSMDDAVSQEVLPCVWLKSMLL